MAKSKKVSAGVPTSVGPAPQGPAPGPTKVGTPAQAGRPAGSKPPAEIVDSIKSRCPKCQSTDRTPYSGTVTVAASGVDQTGQPYTHVVKRWTKCAKCGQARVDQSLENRRG